MAKRFTENAQKIILIAQEEAKRLNHDYVGTEHILLGLCAIEGTLSNRILTSVGVTFRKVRLEIEKMVGIGDTIMLLGEIPFTPRAKKVLEFSVEESQMLNAQHIGTEHILLGLIREEEGMASRILNNLGITLKQYPPQDGFAHQKRSPKAREIFCLILGGMFYQKTCAPITVPGCPHAIFRNCVQPPI